MTFSALNFIKHSRVLKPSIISKLNMHPGVLSYKYYPSRLLFSRAKYICGGVPIQQLNFSTENAVRPNEKKDVAYERKEFQADTKLLLDIVAKSLYSDKEVFIRELISNASDALEKVRYLHLKKGMSEDIGPLEICISTNKQDRTLIIEDSGIGMTREELISNLGTIARSGSKAFLEEVKRQGFGEKASAVIGQFGVGFYSAFMVADSVKVYTQSHQEGAVGCKWVSDGTGAYEIEDCFGLKRGTKIVIQLKTDCREFADDVRVQDVIKKYSNFVNSPILINGQQINKLQPLWIMEPKTVTPEMYNEFYRFISHSYDHPRFTLHFKTDVPFSLQTVLYFPEGKPGLFELNRESDCGVSLYTRRVLIKSSADNILPRWLRFVKGVVDSEEIPLNLSRELLQNSPLINKLKTILTNRIIRFLYDKSVKQKEEYEKFYQDYFMFIKEGIVTSANQMEKEEIGKLLRFESSNAAPNTLVSFPEYCSRLQKDQKQIFYLAAPSRALAENSPYLEALKEKNVEVLFCYEPHDELVLMHLQHFDNNKLTSVESEMRKDSASLEPSLGGASLSKEEAKQLISWLEDKFKKRIHTVRLTGKLSAHPCVITVEEMAAARHFIRTQARLLVDDMKFSLLKPTLELNPRHPVIKKLASLTKTNPELALLVAEQLHSNALIVAGLLEDPRTALKNMNKLLELALQKH